MKKLKEIKDWKIEGTNSEKQFFELLKKFGGDKALLDYAYLQGRLKSLSDKENIVTIITNVYMGFGIWLEKNKLVEYNPVREDKEIPKEFKREFKTQMCG